MSDILQYVNTKPNNELNSKIFKDGKIHYKIVQHLKKIADEFIKYSKIDKYKIPIKDIFVTGSIVNYNYSKYSDIDIHILVDLSNFKGKSKEIAEEYFTTKRMFWNMEHDIKVLGYKVELSVQPIDQEHHTTSTYSLLKNDFVLKPKKQKYKVNKNKVYHYYSEIKKEIDNITCDNIDSVRTKAKALRKKGLDRKNYEYSEQNLVFKILRNKGILDKLSDFKTNCVNDKLSLNENRKQAKQILTSIKQKYNTEIDVNSYLKNIEDIDPSDNNKYMGRIAKWFSIFFKENPNYEYDDFHNFLTDLEEHIKGYYNYASRPNIPQGFEELNNLYQKKYDNFENFKRELLNFENNLSSKKKIDGTLGEKGQQLLYEDDKVIVWKILNKQGMAYCAKDTPWCVSMPASDYYDYYTSKGNKYFIVLRNKKIPLTNEMINIGKTKKGHFLDDYTINNNKSGYALFAILINAENNRVSGQFSYTDFGNNTTSVIDFDKYNKNTKYNLYELLNNKINIKLNYNFYNYYVEKTNDIELLIKNNEYKYLNEIIHSHYTSTKSLYEINDKNINIILKTFEAKEKYSEGLSIDLLFSRLSKSNLEELIYNYPVEFEKLLNLSIHKDSNINSLLKNLTDFNYKLKERLLLDLFDNHYINPDDTLFEQITNYFKTIYKVDNVFNLLNKTETGILILKKLTKINIDILTYFLYEDNISSDMFIKNINIIINLIEVFISYTDLKNYHAEDNFVYFIHSLEELYSIEIINILFEKFFELNKNMLDSRTVYILFRLLKGNNIIDKNYKLLYTMSLYNNKIYDVLKYNQDYIDSEYGKKGKPEIINNY